LATHDPLATGVVQGAGERQPMLTLLDPARIALRMSDAPRPVHPVAAEPPAQHRAAHTPVAA
ncbi:MAG TPA: hypothetical protein VEB23_02645, partial [Ramlibacter sp.]|nr:hypothetical protein [Ramlibacter sp.]